MRRRCRGPEEVLAARHLAGRLGGHRIRRAPSRTRQPPRHPRRVRTRLGETRPEFPARGKALVELVRIGWGAGTPAFRRMFAELLDARGHGRSGGLARPNCSAAPRSPRSPHASWKRPAKSSASARLGAVSRADAGAALAQRRHGAVRPGTPARGRNTACAVRRARQRKPRADGQRAGLAEDSGRGR